MQEELKEDTIDKVSEENVEQDNNETSENVSVISEELETQGVVEKSNQLQSFIPTTPVLQTPNSGFEQVIQAARALESITYLAKHIKTSKLSPLKTEADITLAILTGQQFGFHFMTSISCIFPINNKPTMSIHLQRGLLLNKGVISNKIYNYEPIYEWGKVGEDGAWITKEISVDGQIKKVPTIAGLGTEDTPPKVINGSVAKLKVVDRITKYEFIRKFRQEDGTYKEMKVTSEFKMSDAVQAGLADKDNWIKYPHSMCDARAYGIGSKEIAADILFGIYSVSELADEANIKYTITDSLEESIIKN
jgi:hypothetical protein